MLLRRITEHVKSQNWFAVCIDFCIVVIGVFIGIQVSNWNERIVFAEYEQVLVRELRGEIAQNLADVRAKGDAFLVGAAAARRVLEKVDNAATSCTGDCWATVVDLLHASQWQQIRSNLPAYDELRRQGLPGDRRIVEMVETYKTYGHQVALVLMVPPSYRTLVRGLIPIELQDAYWEHCYTIDNAIEVYAYPCDAPNDLLIDPADISKILADKETIRALREWTSIARVVGTTLTAPQQSIGQEILQRIDAGTGV
jgi:hypothetical protein